MEPLEAGPPATSPKALPYGVLGLCVILGLARLGAALALKSTDAQWQLNYIPIWLVDLPWSAIYFFLLPFPIGEYVIGPIWWALLPLLVWRGLQWRAARRARRPCAAPGRREGS